MNLQTMRGVIRNGDPKVTLRGDTADEAVVSFRFMRDKEKVGVVERRWPADFTIDPAGESGAVTLTETTKFQPYSAVIAEVDGQKLAMDDWGLTKLFALDEAQFEAIFFQARHRPQDLETQHFATRQIQDHYRANPSHRCVAAVIQGYRAIDLNRPEDIKIAIAGLQAELAVAASLPVSWRSRLDGVHLTASMHSVLWQLLLFDGQHDATVRQLDEMVAFLRLQHEPLATIVINACPAFHVRAHLLLAEGRKEEAIDLAFFNAEYYVSSLQRLSRNRKLFREMLPPHNLVIASLDLAERAKKGEKGMESAEVIQLAQRIGTGNGRSAVKVLEDNYATLCRKLRQRRRAEAEARAAAAEV